MKCKFCGKFFYVKRNFVELLGQKIEYLCDRCHNLINLKLEVVELEIYRCYILVMFQKRMNIDYNYFINEYNIIVKKYLGNQNFQFLFFDYLSLTDFNLELLNMISKLFKKHIFVFAFFLKN